MVHLGQRFLPNIRIGPFRSVRVVWFPCQGRQGRCWSKVGGGSDRSSRAHEEESFGPSRRWPRRQTLSDLPRQVQERVVRRRRRVGVVERRECRRNRELRMSLVMLNRTRRPRTDAPFHRCTVVSCDMSRRSNTSSRNGSSFSARPNKLCARESRGDPDRFAQTQSRGREWRETRRGEEGTPHGR